MTVQTNKRHVKNPVLRSLLVLIGWISVGAGVIGLFLPLVPTVPLLLLAAACFARSSERFHCWLLGHNRLGSLVRDYLQGVGIPARTKMTAIGMVWISFPTSAFIFVQEPWVRVLLLTIAAGITFYLLRLPTLPPREGGRS